MNRDSTEHVIGIDLGTTNTVAAYIEGGETVVLDSGDGDRTLPSVVAYKPSGEVVVGHVARRQAITNAERTVSSAKRLMGWTWPEAVEHGLCDLFPKLVEGKKQSVRLDINGRSVSPEEVSAEILRKVRTTVGSILNEDVNKAIITVPAHFNDAQRKATRDAAAIAGLDVLRMINEPTAAALAYGFDDRERGCVAVYDFGGGTFDISILQINDGVFHVKATNGDSFLGGDDFDRRIVEHMSKHFLEDTGIDLLSDRMAVQRMRESAERAKIELSTALETQINLPFITADSNGAKHLEMTFTRAQFEQLVSDLVDKTGEPCMNALADSGMEKSDIDSVILVGGTTRIPMVRERVKFIFGTEPDTNINPEEVVAVGAAVQGGVLKGQVSDVLLLDVIPLSLGIETRGGIFTKLIMRNTTIPAGRKRLFSTIKDNQSTVTIHVLQGEREMARDCKSLGNVKLVGIPPAPHGVPQIEVEFDVDANGILNVSARDLGTEHEQKITVETTGGLDRDEVELLVKESEKRFDEDRRRRAEAEVSIRAELLIAAVARLATGHKSLVSEEQGEELAKQVRLLRQALDSGQTESITRETDILERMSHSISRLVYGQARRNQQNESAPVDASPSLGDDAVNAGENTEKSDSDR